MNAFKSNLIDDPMVLQINTLLKYLPFTPEGRFFSID